MTVPATRPTRLIALMNQKGGVGKTTTTVNLSAAFARAGRRTLIVDLDPQAHASLHVGIDPDGVESSVYDVMLDPAFDVRSAIRVVSENLSILPAQTDMAAAESELSSEQDRFIRLRRALESLGDTYEFVMMDCPPSLGLLTISGLAAAREVLIPMQAHFLALQGVGKLLETVTLVTGGINPRLLVSGVILCAHDPGTMHAREVVSDLDQFFDSARGKEVPWRHARVYRPAIRRNIKLAECPSYGRTIFDYAPEASGAVDYAALAGVLLADWDAMLARQSDPSGAAVVVRGVGAGSGSKAEVRA